MHDANQIAKDLANKIVDIVDDIGKAREKPQQELRNQAIREDEVRDFEWQLDINKLDKFEKKFEKKFNRWMFIKPRPNPLKFNVAKLGKEINEAKDLVNEEDAPHKNMMDANPADHLPLKVEALRKLWKDRVNQILQMEADHDVDKNQENLVDPDNPILEEPVEAPHQNAFEDLGGVGYNVNINNKQKDNKQMITNVTIGADPELFIFNTSTKSVVSSIGLIPGEKGKPWRDKKWAKGFGLEIDNILGEFNIPPAHTKNEFIESINFMKKYIREFVKKKNPDYDIRCRASYMVPEDQLQSDEAKMFG